MCLPPVFVEKALWDLEAWKTENHRKQPEKKSSHLSNPTPLLTSSGLGTRVLENGQRWMREKHRWLSDGLALNELDSPTQAQHLRGHFHNGSKISQFQQFQPADRNMEHSLIFTKIRKEVSKTTFPHFLKKKKKKNMYCLPNYIYFILVLFLKAL